MVQLTNKLLAAQSYTLTGPGIPATSGTAVSSLERIISTGIGVLTIIGVIFFTIQVILAGFSLISTQGDLKEFEQNKKRLNNNILGLVVIVIAYGLGALLTTILGITNVFDLTNNSIFSTIR